MKFINAIAVVGLITAPSAVFSRDDCVKFNPDDTKVVNRGSVQTIVGPLAEFNPCHPSVKLSLPTLFSKQRGDKPPLVIISHGGGGLGSYEREFARLMNENGFATLLFDSFEMNGLKAFSDSLLYFTGNGSRQRMIFKATLGAYKWALKNEKVDTKKFFFQGVSNGGSVAINMAAATDPSIVRGVIAEGAGATGIGFPDDPKVAILMVYGAADNYGGEHSKDFLHERSMPCGYNEHYGAAPQGYTKVCNLATNSKALTPSPVKWAEDVRRRGHDIRFEVLDFGGHGMLFSDFKTFSKVLPNGRVFYQSHGAPTSTRDRLEKLILSFIESKL